jgi:hypothetical protein
VSFDKLIDEKIARAMAEGEFDNLPGKGQPLDLEWYFQLPEDLRMSYSVLKNANCPPEEAQLMKELESLREQLSHCLLEERKRELRKTIAEKTLNLNMLLDSRKRR